MIKILVLGGAGMWGHQAFLKLSEHFGHGQVSCTLRKPKAFYSRIGLFKEAQVYDQVDFLDFEKSKQVLEDYNPNWIINCVGLTPRKYDVHNEKLYQQVNVGLPQKLTGWIKNRDTRLIHFSTDCVFNGKKGEYSESDPTDAEDVYGKSKAAGEIKDSPQVLTYRLSKIGREIEKKTEIVEWLLANKGQMVQGFSKALYSGLTTNAMAHELVRVIEKFPTLSGLYQISSSKISKYELLKLLNQVYTSGVEIQNKSDYAVDKSLNCDLYSRVTGFKRPHWLDMIQAMKQEERIDYDSFK